MTNTSAGTKNALTISPGRVACTIERDSLTSQAELRTVNLATGAVSVIGDTGVTYISALE